MDITPDKKKLSNIVNSAYEGEICLPGFQRDFIWERDNVADLMRSVLRGVVTPKSWTQNRLGLF